MIQSKDTNLERNDCMNICKNLVYRNKNAYIIGSNDQN